jgi:hypothetical protein
MDVAILFQLSMILMFYKMKNLLNVYKLEMHKDQTLWNKMIFI